MCPPLTDEDLKRWRFKKIYPKEDNFMECMGHRTKRI